MIDLQAELRRPCLSFDALRGRAQHDSVVLRWQGRDFQVLLTTTRIGIHKWLCSVVPREGLSLARHMLSGVGRDEKVYQGERGTHVTRLVVSEDFE